MAVFLISPGSTRARAQQEGETLCVFLYIGHCLADITDPVHGLHSTVSIRAPGQPPLFGANQTGRASCSREQGNTVTSAAKSRGLKGSESNEKMHIYEWGIYEMYRRDIGESSGQSRTGKYLPSVRRSHM